MTRIGSPETDKELKWLGGGIVTIFEGWVRVARYSYGAM